MILALFAAVAAVFYIVYLRSDRNDYKTRFESERKRVDDLCQKEQAKYDQLCQEAQEKYEALCEQEREWEEHKKKEYDEFEAYVEALDDDSVAPKQKLQGIIDRMKEAQRKIARINAEAQLMQQRAQQFLMEDPDGQAQQIADARMQMLMEQEAQYAEQEAELDEETAEAEEGVDE